MTASNEHLYPGFQIDAQVLTVLKLLMTDEMLVIQIKLANGSMCTLTTYDCFSLHGKVWDNKLLMWIK